MIREITVKGNTRDTNRETDLSGGKHFSWAYCFGLLSVGHVEIFFKCFFFIQLIFKFCVDDL